MVEAQNNQQQTQVENKQSDKEYNFRAVEEKARRNEQARVEAEKRAQDAERKLQEMESRQNKVEEEDNDDEPYVDKKKLEKKLARFGQSTQTEIQKAMEIAKQAAKEELKQEFWLDKNKDFYDVMQHAQKLYEKDQELAETILQMPESFERQKLVYKNIKALGLDKPPQKQSTVQDQIDANKRSPYYQPSGVASAPYAGAGDFSASGQKNAYTKMQELKNRLSVR